MDLVSGESGESGDVWWYIMAIDGNSYGRDIMISSWYYHVLY